MIGKYFTLLRFKDLQGGRKFIVLVALFFSLVPGLFFILSALLTNIEGPNPFVMASIFIFSAPAVLAGIVTYFITDKYLKRKLTHGLLLIIFQLSILPIIWGINNIKLRMFISKNQAELELISNNLLDNKWTLDYAVEYTTAKKFPLRLLGKIEGDKTVLFFVSGILDNCHGIAFSRTGNEATDNQCGKLSSWKKLKSNWYEWGSV